MLAKRDCQMTIGDCDAEKLQNLRNTLGGSCAAVVTDILKETDCDHLVETAVRTHGRLNALINATSVLSIAPADSISLEQFRQSLDVNVTGALLITRAAALFMRSGGGYILHISSVSSLVVNPSYAAYASSKAALSDLVRVLAWEWAEFGIRVNALGPAMTETPLNIEYLANPEYRKKAFSVIPLGRFGVSEDLFDPALLLISQGGRFITGQTLYVDGGRTLV